MYLRMTKDSPSYKNLEFWKKIPQKLTSLNLFAPQFQMLDLI